MRQRRPTGRRLAIIAAGVALAAAGAGACGVTRESDFQPFGPDEPFGVSTTTTTTTTTTTVATTTTTVPEAPATVTTAAVTGPITSTTLVATEPVQLYFVVDTALTNVSRELARPASLRQVVAALEEGPPSGAPGTGLRSLILPDLITSVIERDGQAHVDLNTEVLSEIDTTDQRLAVAQLVLTLGVRPGVGQVAFSSDGDPLAVPVPSRGNLLSEPGEALSRDDFALALISSAPVPDTGVDTGVDTVPITDDTSPTDDAASTDDAAGTSAP
ncbi:hypothetical protein BH20ACT4_BH20ACT4_01300 [soil metagenome]